MMCDIAPTRMPATFANPAGHVQGGRLGAMLDGLTTSIRAAVRQPGQRVTLLNLDLAFVRPARIFELQAVAAMAAMAAAAAVAV